MESEYQNLESLLSKSIGTLKTDIAIFNFNTHHLRESNLSKMTSLFSQVRLAIDEIGFCLIWGVIPKERVINAS